MKVVKFGGTSLATAEQIKKVCNIVISDPQRRIIVVSAPGKRFKDDIKVTDLLIECAEKYLQTGNADNQLNAVLERYKQIASDLVLPGEIIEVIESDLKKRLNGDISNKDKFMDSLKAAGEDNTAKLVAFYLKSIGVNAAYVDPAEAGLYLTDEYGNAQVLPESYQNLKVLKERSELIIFPGFFGYSKSGDVVTFPRGGSDITGSILAAAVGAELYENFTDVDSVFAANPNIIDNPKPIKEITYREMRELSYAGFSVLHEETLAPVFKANIPVCIKNTNNPSAPGTIITPSRKDTEPHVTGIAGATGFCSIYVSKYMMNREVGFGRKLLQILEEEGISYEHTPSGIDNISVIINEKQLSKELEEKIMARIKNELSVDDVSITHDLALIIIVGEGMKNTIGMAARATRALSGASINIEMINQGSSEISIMFGVKADNCNKAVKALYDEFF